MPGPGSHTQFLEPRQGKELTPECINLEETRKEGTAISPKSFYIIRTSLAPHSRYQLLCNKFPPKLSSLKHYYPFSICHSLCRSVFSDGLAGWCWFRVQMRLQSRCQLRLQPTESSPGLEGSCSKWSTHMAGKMVLAVGRSLTTPLGPDHQGVVVSLCQRQQWVWPQQVPQCL